MQSKPIEVGFTLFNLKKSNNRYYFNINLVFPGYKNKGELINLNQIFKDLNLQSRKINVNDDEALGFDYWAALNEESDEEEKF